MTVLVSAIGQYDNVGDTVLRRGYLDHLRTVGPLCVYIGNRPDTYLSALGLQPSDRVFRDNGSWRAEVGRRLRSGTGVYAFNTGETEVEAAFARRYLKLAPLLATNRARGGVAVQLGMGVRSATPWRLPIASVLRLCDLVTWRDQHSRDVMRVGEVTPDWAFTLGSPVEALRPATPRPRLAVSVRQGLSHAPRLKPNDLWVSRVRRIAEEHGLEPIVVAQIGRDGPLAQELADRLGCDALTWLDDDHARQEERLRAVYRESAMVLTDRLHAAVIGVTEGAVPIALATADPATGVQDKVTRTLAGAGITETSIGRSLPDMSAALSVIGEALGRRDEILDAVDGARVTLTGLTSRVREITSGMSSVGASEVAEPASA